jgi:hypothetical protein
LNNNSLDIIGKIQIITSLLTLFIGLAVSIGGAIASIQVASLGLEISKKQEQRDNIAFLEEKASNSVKLFSNLLISINKIYSSSILIDSEVQKTIEQSSISNSDEIVDKITNAKFADLETTMSLFSKDLLEISDIVNNIIMDDFAYYCIKQQISKDHDKLKLEHISQKLKSFGLPDREVSVHIEHLIDFNTLLRIATAKINKYTWSDLVAAKLLTNLTETDVIFSKIEYDNQAVRSFIFLGNLIYHRTEVQPNKTKFAALYGAAILHDLVQIIPQDKNILEYLKQLYPSMIEGDNIPKIFFEPSVISQDILNIINDIENIGDLYVLTTPQLPSFKD